MYKIVAGIADSYQDTDRLAKLMLNEGDELQAIKRRTSPFDTDRIAGFPADIQGGDRLIATSGLDTAPSPQIAGRTPSATAKGPGWRPSIGPRMGFEATFATHRHCLAAEFVS